MKKIIFCLLVVVCFWSENVLANCDYSSIARMKNIINNINISYDYYFDGTSPYFSVTISNLTNDIYFYDTITGRNYFYSESINGDITIFNYSGMPGKYMFYSNDYRCYGTYLNSKYYKFPSYNKYYTHPLCEDVPNFTLCQKWSYINYSEEEFKKQVDEYKNSKMVTEDEKIKVEYEKGFLDKLVDIYVEYYYLFYGAVIVVCLIIIFANYKKNSFKL